MSTTPSTPAEVYFYKARLEYLGTNYCGWQIQPNAISVQEVLEKTLSTVLRETVEVIGAGRTDTGVHASFFVLHFELEKEIQEPENLLYKLNSLLPYDIVCQKIWPVEPDVHARFSAVSRTYKYYISTQKNPFKTDTSFKYLLPLDIDKMNEAARILAEYEDFTSFSRLHTCLLYTSPSPRDRTRSRMPSSA